MSAILLAAALAAAPAIPAGPVASEIRRLSAPEAGQGVASGRHGLYAIDNRTIARLDPATGRTIARWDGDAAHFKHINSCMVRASTLVCAASNYPGVPTASRIETFDAVTLRHLATRELGEGHGSLTWALWRKGPDGAGWWLCYANYDGKGGVPGRDHRFTTLVRTDAAFRERATWRFPDAVLDRMAPRSASGGVFGADGLLYVTGHDRPELYALRVPARQSTASPNPSETGGTLELVATIAIPTDGQAIGWDVSEPRLLWTIERKTHELVASRVPDVGR